MGRALAAAARLIALLVALGAAAMAPARAAPVDLELLLAVDASRSIDDAEFTLQIQGYAAAFRHPSVLAAIRAGEHRRIAVAYVQWAGPALQAMVIEWMEIGDAASAEAFARRMETAPRVIFGGGTSLSGAIDFARRAFERKPSVARRRVVDVSGDGINNVGRQPDDARNAAVADGITINGLAIETDVPWLGDYFAEHVIGGPGSFVMAVRSFETFAHAVLNKLIREIADRSANDRPG